MAFEQHGKRRRIELLEVRGIDHDAAVGLVLQRLREQALHRAVYAVALLAILHFFWMRAAKHNFAEVAVYAAIIGLLLGWRLWTRWRARTQPAVSSSSTP